ncbi:BrnT family toxin [Chelativorans sp. ZYF759]|uniref:BrnT family toxin n=1 Tax=Chelativorans sp. ZYF759 TaxID=2692213 RepID=UPI00145F0DEB|nr:BrnT family toxin [Chelativorans sp. ZYF759]NMG39525.1 BrnT family toxin [Chelativorans sp. ZYF759]
MEFEYDPSKSATNKDKHGIDFEESKALWQDEWLLILDARTETEPRFLAIGRIARVNWTAICTDRAGRTRIISVRRSRQKEIEAYEEDHRS